MVVDISGISYFAPILAFLVVFVIIFALLNKTKLIGENAFIQIFVSFLIGTIFVSAAGVRDYVLTITPWFGLLIISLFFVLFVIGFVGKPVEFMTKGIGIIFILLLIIVFLVSGFVVFSETLAPYLPGGRESWVYSSRVVGALLLVVISAIVSGVLVRHAKEKKD